VILDDLQDFTVLFGLLLLRLKLKLLRGFFRCSKFWQPFGKDGAGCVSGCNSSWLRTVSFASEREEPEFGAEARLIAPPWACENRPAVARTKMRRMAKVMDRARRMECLHI